MPSPKDVVVKRNSEEGEEQESSKELSPRRSDGRRPAKGHLDRGWVKHRLIRDFAIGEKTGQDMAIEYGVSQNSISIFKKRYSLEIEEVKNNLADEYAGVWVAKKLDRIREYQNAAEKMASGESARSQEVLVNILKAVAEELGDLPARQQVHVSGESVTYAVIGITPEDLT